MDTIRKDESAGFTLVEIIVTLVILAVLAAFTIPAMLGWVSNSREKLCQIARYDIQRYYKTQAVGDRPMSADDAKMALQKAVVNSYGADDLSGTDAINICPSGGKYPLGGADIKYTKSSDGVFYEVSEITCTKHGNIRPNLTSTKSILEQLKDTWTGNWTNGQSAFLADFKKANGGKFDTVDEVDLINAFGEDWKSTLYQSPSALYWRPYILTVGGEQSSLTYASKAGNDSNNHGNWAATLIEFNGQYYVSTKTNSTNQKIEDGSVSGIKGQSFENDAAVIEWLSKNNFEAVTN